VFATGRVVSLTVTPRSDWSRPRVTLAVAAICALAAALRLASLGGKSLWLDEAFSVALARAPWPVFVRELQTKEANMGLYYLLLRWWLPLGLSESVVRLLSALIGIATVPVIYVVGTRLFGRRAGLVAALALALDPFHLALSQDARSYPLAMFLVVCSVWAFTHVVEDATPSPAIAKTSESGQPIRQAFRVWAWRTGYVIASAAAVYAHLYAAFVLLAEWTSLLLKPPRRTMWRAVITSAAAIVLLVSPLIAFVLRGQHRNIDWIAAELPYAVAHLWQNVRTPVGSVATLYGILLAALIWAVWRITLRRRGERSAWPYLLITLWLATPIVIPIIFSVLVKPVFDARYAAVGLPAVALLVGAFAERLSSRRQMIALLAVIGTLEASGDWAYFAQVHKEDWRGATFWVLATAARGDVAVFYAPYVRRPYDYYVSRLQQPSGGPRVLYPSPAYVAFGSGDSTTLTLTGALMRAAQTAPRTWLIVSHARSDTGCQEALDAALRDVYGTARGYHFKDIDVWLYSGRDLDPRGVGASASLRTGLAAVAHRCPQG
jgi:mannosyltransferase